jgi:hypothetical protein
MTGTDGWHTAITCVSGPSIMHHRDDVVDVVVEVEAPSASGTWRASTQSVM